MSARSEARQRVRGLYALTDAATTPDPVAHGARLVTAGVRLLQLRCKGWAADDVLRAARELAPRCVAAGATFLVNDLPEVAVASGAHGVHVGQDDGPAAAIRQVLGEDLILGRSTGRLEELDAACEGADYVAFGPIWETTRMSRPKPVRGPELLAAAVARVGGRVPLVAIGGIDADRVAAVIDAGADAWAVIGALAVADVDEAVERLSCGR